MIQNCDDESNARRTKSDEYDDDISFSSAQEHHTLMFAVQESEEQYQGNGCHSNIGSINMHQTFPSPLNIASISWTKAVVQENLLLRQLLASLCESLQLSCSSEAITNGIKFNELESLESVETISNKYQPLTSGVVESIRQELLTSMGRLREQQHDTVKMELTEYPRSKTNRQSFSDEPIGIDGDYFHHSDNGSDNGYKHPQHQEVCDGTTIDSANWIECTEVHPPPPFDLESPVVGHILSTWTDDPTKINFLTSWIKSLKFTAHETYPVGIQITSISRVLRDAFVVLVIPLMRLQSIDPLVVYTREYSINNEAPKINSSSSLRRNDEQQGNFIDFDDADNRSATSSSHPPTAVHSDPFVKAHDIVFDIRVKRIVDPSHLKHAMNQPCQYRDVGQADLDHPGFRVDSRDYSSLTEINTIFEEIDKKHIPTIKDEVRQLSADAHRHLSSSGNSQTLLATQQHQQLLNAYQNHLHSKDEEETTITLAPKRTDLPNANLNMMYPEQPASPPAYLPASIASWFYGTKITDTHPVPTLNSSEVAADIITASLLDRHFASGPAVSVPHRGATNLVNGNRSAADNSDVVSVTSETSSNADSIRAMNGRKTDKIAARLEALRKKHSGGKLSY